MNEIYEAGDCAIVVGIKINFIFVMDMGQNSTYSKGTSLSLVHADHNGVHVGQMLSKVLC